MSKRRDDDPLEVKVAQLEVDVKWLKKLITPSLILQVATFLTVLALILRLMGG